jgi:hypothetical protein
MKIIWLSLFWLFAIQALGQRAGGLGGLGRGGFGPGRVMVGGFPGGFPRGGFGRGGVVQGGVRPGNRVVVIGGFGFPSQSFATFGIPPLGPIPPLGGSAPLFAFGNRFGLDRRSFRLLFRCSSAVATSGTRRRQTSPLWSSRLLRQSFNKHPARPYAP